MALLLAGLLVASGWFSESLHRPFRERLFRGSRLAEAFLWMSPSRYDFVFVSYKSLLYVWFRFFVSIYSDAMSTVFDLLQQLKPHSICMCLVRRALFSIRLADRQPLVAICEFSVFVSAMCVVFGLV